MRYKLFLLFCPKYGEDYIAVAGDKLFARKYNN